LKAANDIFAIYESGRNQKNFPESAREIEDLENLGFASRRVGWIDDLDLEKARTACWLLGKIGDDRDADTLINVLLSQRSELWMEAATSLNAIGTEKQVTPLLSLLTNDAEIDRQVGAVYALSSIAIRCQESRMREILNKLLEAAANTTLAAAVRGNALEGLTGISREIFPDLYQQAVSVILAALNDGEAEVRFWACFAVAGLEIKEAMDTLRVLVTDREIVLGWWSVSEEAEDTITRLNGGDPPLRKPRS
jgi:HEAT repeat protein